MRRLRRFVYGVSHNFFVLKSIILHLSSKTAHICYLCYFLQNSYLYVFSIVPFHELKFLCFSVQHYKEHAVRPICQSRTLQRQHSNAVNVNDPSTPGVDESYVHRDRCRSKKTAEGGVCVHHSCHPQQPQPPPRPTKLSKKSLGETCRLYEPRLRRGPSLLWSCRTWHQGSYQVIIY